MNNGDLPAFPNNPYGATGLTKREWFAGQADIPWNAVIETLLLQGNNAPTVDELLAERTLMAYQQADTMLKEV